MVAALRRSAAAARCIANRGLSGIDGTVSTAVGAALGRPRRTAALALIGDVTFLHDANGLVLGPDEPRPDLTIVVVNDDGGSIFATLEQGAPEYADRYDRLFGTPHGVDLASLCAATRTPHWRVDLAAELEQALASPNGGIEVVEAVVRRDNRRDLDDRIRALGATLSKPDQDGSRRSRAQDGRHDRRRRHVRRVRRRASPARSTTTRRSGEDWAARLHFSRFHFDRIIKSVAGEPPQALPPADPARAGGVPADHHDGAAARHRGRGGLRLARGVHPRVHQGVRRAAAPSGARSPAHDPDRRAQRRALPPAREPPAARARQGDLHGPR